jgi:hypothetical protein
MRAPYFYPTSTQTGMKLRELNAFCSSADKTS